MISYALYRSSGKVVVPSGQIAFEQVATLEWSSERAQARMDNLIAAHYSGGQKLHAVLCSNDSTALGVTNSLLGAGFTKRSFPLITGQDCDIANTKNIIAGYQGHVRVQGHRTLAAQVVKMVQAIVNR